ncbi:MAG TPA: nucleoside-diphosphate kinase, partial [Candidatus Omnitrophota bacterium]|nr:nucleoside-diphosphate kinase [Candidatus Omnitrophota bacterium]
ELIHDFKELKNLPEAIEYLIASDKQLGVGVAAVMTEPSISTRFAAAREEINRLIERVKGVFEEKFGDYGVIAIGPGRANLIGEHVDYPSFELCTMPDGTVVAPHNYSLPFAVQYGVVVVCRPRGDSKVIVHSIDFDQTYEFDINTFTASDKRSVKSETWINYVMGAYQAAREQGLAVSGAEIVIGGNVPRTGGVSSSAGYCNALVLSFSSMFGWDKHTSRPGKVELCLLARSIEHSEFVGSSCGYLDQLASMFGKEGFAAMIDYGAIALIVHKLERGESITEEDVDQLISMVPLDALYKGGYEIVLVNSNAERPVGGLASTNYNVRVKELVAAGAAIGGALGNGLIHISCYTEDDLARIEAILSEDGTSFKRARHVLTEKARTLRTKNAFYEGDINAVLEQVNACGDSLMMNGDFEISAFVNKETGVVLNNTQDILVQTARRHGVDAARMMGGGGGGITVLVVKVAADTFDWRRQIVEETAAQSVALHEDGTLNLDKKAPEFVGEAIPSEGARVVEEKSLYPAIMSTTSEEDRNATPIERATVATAFGGVDNFKAVTGREFDDLTIVMSGALSSPAAVAPNGVLFVNPNTLRGPPEQLRAIFEGHELFHLANPAASEDVAQAYTRDFLVRNNLLVAHIAYLNNNEQGIVADATWLAALEFRLVSPVVEAIQTAMREVDLPFDSLFYLFGSTTQGIKHDVDIAVATADIRQAIGDEKGPVFSRRVEDLVCQLGFTEATILPECYATVSFMSRYGVYYAITPETVERVSVDPGLWGGMLDERQPLGAAVRGVSENIDSTYAFAIIKPDGYEMRTDILACLEEDFEIVRVIETTVSKETAAAHYKEHEDKPFYGFLVDYITSGPVVVIVLKSRDGQEGWSKLRALAGATRGTEPGTIRHDFGTVCEEETIASGTITRVYNKFHCSDSFASMLREMWLFNICSVSHTDPVYGDGAALMEET